ncbi:redoxin domain-containing protein [Roseovarius amoyensis]|uniref:redoxin domain-containing protein n=1 Tax=Roseovarius amoyensis TaxID=2211448 RepID=UPI000DBE5567|nr:redoxin domain-containing protein [Roseovarius amoyensis]
MAIQFFSPRGAHNEIIKLPTSLRRTVKWLPQIGDIVPDFTIETTQGVLRFWDWAEGSWVHLFSTPHAGTPVCTTEVVSIASCADAWEANNVKHLSLTGATITDQLAWHDEIEAVFKTPIHFPCAYDPGHQLSKLFGMMHEKQATDRSIRKSFIIDPAHRIGLIQEYPLYVGRNTEEILRIVKALQVRSETGAATPADWYGGDMVVIVDNRPEKEVIAEFGNASVRLTPYLRVVSPRGPEDEPTSDPANDLIYEIDGDLIET